MQRPLEGGLLLTDRQTGQGGGQGGTESGATQLLLQHQEEATEQPQGSRSLSGTCHLEGGADASTGVTCSPGRSAPAAGDLQQPKQGAQQGAQQSQQPAVPGATAGSAAMPVPRARRSLQLHAASQSGPGTATSGSYATASKLKRRLRETESLLRLTGMSQDDCEAIAAEAVLGGGAAGWRWQGQQQHATVHGTSDVSRITRQVWEVCVWGGPAGCCRGSRQRERKKQEPRPGRDVEGAMVRKLI